MASEFGFTFSFMIMPVVQYFVRHFRYMQLMLFAYECIFLVYLHKLPESPRWLLSKGHTDRATKLIKQAAKDKGISNEEIERKVKLLQQYLEEEQEQRRIEAKKNLLDLWKTPVMLKYCLVLYLITVVAWFVTYSFVYNADLFGGSLHLNLFVQGERY